MSNIDDEDPRPTKRRKPLVVSTDVTLKPLRELSPKSRLRRPYILTPPAATELEIYDMQSQAEQGYPPTLINNAQHFTPPASQNSSAVMESVPAAEYREWPLQGFLKRTIIGNETTYSLQFNSTHIPEHLELSILFNALGMGSSRETAVWSPVSHSAVAYNKNNEDEDGVAMVCDKKAWPIAKILGETSGKYKVLWPSSVSWGNKEDVYADKLVQEFKARQKCSDKVGRQKRRGRSRKTPETSIKESNGATSPLT